MQVRLRPSKSIQASEHVVPNVDIEGSQLEEVVGEHLPVVGASQERRDAANLPAVACPGQSKKSFVRVGRFCLSLNGTLRLCSLRVGHASSLPMPAKGVMATAPKSGDGIETIGMDAKITAVAFGGFVVNRVDRCPPLTMQTTLKAADALVSAGRCHTDVAPTLQEAGGSAQAVVAIQLNVELAVIQDDDSLGCLCVHIGAIVR